VPGTAADAVAAVVVVLVGSLMRSSYNHYFIISTLRNAIMK
jgi:hypothetical protein